MRSSLWDAFVIAIWVEKYLSVIHKKFNYHFLINKVRLYAFISLSISILLFLPGFTATYRSKNDLDLQIKKVIEKVSTQNLQATITHLQSYGNRTTNEKQREAALWVREEFKKLGLKNDLHEYEFDGKKWPNVIAKIVSNSRPDEIVMLICHIDSISDTSETIAPGADDNASGVAVLLEAARILKDISLEQSVFFVVFTNEEHCRQGSRSYAHLARANGLNIKAVINLDILGYNQPTWPFCWNAVMGHHTLKHKVKAMIRMARNYFLGIIYGKDTMRVAGKEPNRKLVTAASKILREVSELKVKELVSNDSG